MRYLIYGLSKLFDWHGEVKSPARERLDGWYKANYDMLKNLKSVNYNGETYYTRSEVEKILKEMIGDIESIDKSTGGLNDASIFGRNSKREEIITTAKRYGFNL